MRHANPHHQARGHSADWQYEVRYSDGRPSFYHYFEDDPGRRSITRKMTSAQALQAAQALAQASRTSDPDHLADE